jgi:hypothetical protein
MEKLPLNNKSRFLIAIAVTLILLVSLSGCASGSQHDYMLAPASELPAFVHDAPVSVQEAYQFAVANPHELENYPCYCGCGAMGHTSNLSCYIQTIDDDGAITFDNHAAGCGICVDITQDVMRLMDEGQSPPEIRTYIDVTYSPFGPSTDTPFPQS